MADYLTSQTLIYLFIVAIMLFIFYFILSYIFSKYQTISRNMDNLSQETRKLNKISEKIESKMDILKVKSESKENISTDNQENI